ncbi:MAG: acetyl-CoA decarbonylase/synthase complex subunit gamma [Bacillota bacterium]
MGLTGLDIYKQLPKKNCGECGPPTCLAFAMALASGKAALDSCPYVTDAAKENLGAASAPPIRMVKVGTGDVTVTLGDETVIFRHDKTFFHETGVAIEVSDKLSAADIDAKVGKINGLVFERVGLRYTVNLVAVKNESGNAEAFKAAVDKVAAGTKFPLILMTDDPEAMDKAAAGLAAARPLLYAATAANFDKMVEVAKKHSCPLAIRGQNLDEAAALAEKAVAGGCKDLVIDAGRREFSAALADLTEIRRLAIKKKFRPLGFPTIAFPQSDEPYMEILQASYYVGKYASVVVVRTAEKAHILPLLTWRQNIYTDPQKPIQVEPKLHEVGAVTADSPVYITTNFSLTYYTVEGEVAGSKIPAYILPVNTDGTSVLTAWASGKFSAESIAEAIKSSALEQKVNHRNLILPGYVAVLSGKLAELSGWKVGVGPREAAGIPSFAKAKFAS